MTPSRRSRICQRGTLMPMRCMASVTPKGASISSVGGWKEPARWSSVSRGSASITFTLTPWCASDRAVARPTGPAPTISTPVIP